MMFDMGYDKDIIISNSSTQQKHKNMWIYRIILVHCITPGSPYKLMME